MSDTSLIELIEDCTLFGGTFPNERIEEAKEFFSKQKAALHLRGVNQRYFAVGYVGTMPNGHYTGLLDITTNRHYLSRALTIKNINELHPAMHGIVLTNITEMTKDDFDSWTNDG